MAAASLTQALTQNSAKCIKCTIFTPTYSRMLPLTPTYSHTLPLFSTHSPILPAGSCAAYQLAKQNIKCVLLEQYDFLHRRGSSHGESRIIRRTYKEQHFTNMMTQAYRRGVQGTALLQQLPAIHT